MTWFTSADNLNAADAAHAELTYFVSLDMPSGMLRLHTRVGTVQWGSVDWLGVGTLGSISDIAEDAILRPQGVEFTLSGVDSALITAARTEQYHGRPVAVYMGFLNITTLQLTATPETVFRGLMDTMTIDFGPNTGSITVHAEGELARWQRNSGWTYTTESQKEIYPDDKGFDNIPTIQARTVNWGKRESWGTKQAFQRIIRGMGYRP